MSSPRARARARVARSLASADGVAHDVRGWLDDHAGDPAFARFGNHFLALRTVLERMLAAIRGELREAARLAGSGAVYERCRELDRSLIVAQRTFDWYAGKYDQRRDPRLAAVVRAADEVVRSCWSEPFHRLGKAPPTGPLPYLDIRFDAYATPRVSVPPDLRAPADAPVAEHVRQLPIPAIALPAPAVREAWWVALAAHETAHHIQHDLALEAATRNALPPDWAGWHREVFADALSVPLVGGAAAWAVDELQHATPARMVTVPRPGDRYPPPIVRLALLYRLASMDGDFSGQLNYEGVPDRSVEGVVGRGLWDGVSDNARAQAVRHLEQVPAVAVAMARLIGDLAEPLPEDRVRWWAERLLREEPPLSGIRRREAARVVVSAGVQASVAHGTTDKRTLLHDNLLEILPACGPEGVLAPAASPAGIDALADRLARRLVAGGGEGPG